MTGEIALRPSYWASVSGGKDSLYMLNYILHIIWRISSRQNGSKSSMKWRKHNAVSRKTGVGTALEPIPS